MFFDTHILRATIKGEEARQDCRTCEILTTAREVWTRATTKAAARKATAPGVIGYTAEALPGGQLFIFQVSGYTPTRGAYCDMLNERGQVIKTY